MAMFNPPHPGEFITEIYLEPHGISGRELADKLDVAASTLSRILKGTSRVTPEMALRLSKAVGRSGSPPFSRTLTRRPIKAMRSVHVEAKEVQHRVQARCG